MRSISSITSTSRNTSTLYVGMLNCNASSVSLFTTISKLLRILLIVSFGIDLPMSESTFLKLKSTCGWGASTGYISRIAPSIVPPAISFTKRAARFSAYNVLFGSNPLSNRNDESVLSAWRRADLRTQVGLK